MTIRHLSRRNLVRVAGGAVLCAAGVLASFAAWRDIAHIALRDEESSHAFLVPIAFVWLIWVRRQRWRTIRPLGKWLGPVLVLAGWLCYDVGDSQLWQSVWHAGAVITLIGCCVAAWGKDILLKFFPAFLVLFFVIPVPGRVRQRIAIPLQTATAATTQEILGLFGINAQRSGNMLSIDDKDVAIAEACNGMRMTFALALVSYVFAFGNPLRGYVRLIVVAASPLSAIVCNVVRLVPTVWIYARFPSSVGDRFHDFSGWIMLFVAFLVLMGIIRMLRWALVPVAVFTLAND